MMGPPRVREERVMGRDGAAITRLTSVWGKVKFSRDHVTGGRNRVGLSQLH